MKKYANLFVIAMALAASAKAADLCQIRPFNVGSKVLSYRVSGSGLFIPAVIDNSEAAQAYLKGYVQIKNIEIGQPWKGENTNVQIRNALNRRCLTVTGSSALGLSLEWIGCLQPNAGVAFKRQVFFLRTNGHRNTAIETLIQEDLGLPSAVRKCILQVTPTQVALRDCPSLGNWSISH